MTKVSVVIPTYNYGRFVGEAIRSVLAQTFTDFELMVVDDGSTDDTKEVVTSFNDARIKYIYQENLGVGAALNNGIKASIGEYVTILGSDDVYLPQNLELKAKLLDTRPDIGLVCSDLYVFDNDTGAILGRFWRDKKVSHYWVDPERAARQPLKELLYRGCFIMPQATMIRRTVLNEVGGFDESLPTHEDWDLFVRIILHFSIQIIDMPLLKLRRHNTNLSENKDKMYWGAVGAINKAMRSGALSGAEMKLLKQRLAPQHFNFGRQAMFNGKAALARKALMDGIRLDPWHVKSYVYLVLLTFGTRPVLALRSWKKGLVHRQLTLSATRK